MQTRKWLDPTFIGQKAVCTMHLGHVSIFFSYLDCCFWCVAMQKVAKSSPSTKEGHMMVVNRFDVHINGH